MVILAPLTTSAQPKPGKVMVYAGLGSELIQYDVDVEHATLTKRGSVMLPANVQEAWRHPSKPILYMAWSDRGPGAGSPAGNHHGLTAFTIDGVSGALRPHGPVVTLRSRTIHLTVDPQEHILSHTTSRRASRCTGFSRMGRSARRSNRPRSNWGSTRIMSGSIRPT
jgi:hypothetical protein